jgi:hypothetical protein
MSLVQSLYAAGDRRDSRATPEPIANHNSNKTCSLLANYT